MIALKSGKTDLLSMPQLEPMADWQNTGLKGLRSVIFLSLILSFSSAFASGQESHAHEQDSTHDHHEQSVQLALSRFVKPMGIATLTVVILTVLSGLLRRKNPKFLLKWHKRLGVAVLVFAIVHATLVLITH
jgi:hypothetical protein